MMVLAEGRTWTSSTLDILAYEEANYGLEG